MATKKSTRKPTFVDKLQKAYQRGTKSKIDAAVNGSSAASKRMQKAESKLLKGNRFGEPAEMSEAKKARIRANRAKGRK